MTLVTGTVQDLGYDGMEGTLWARPARFRSDGQVVYAPERKPYKVVDGVVSADLAPGPAVLELQVGSHARGTFEVVIPEEDTTLADLLDTVFAWEPAQVSLFVAEREAAELAKTEAEAAAGQAVTAAGTATSAAQQTGQDRSHVDQVRTELDEAFDESTAGNVLPPRLTETALNATYGPDAWEDSESDLRSIADALFARRGTPVLAAPEVRTWGHSFMAGVTDGAHAGDQGMAPRLAEAVGLPLAQFAVGGTALYSHLSAAANWGWVLQRETRGHAFAPRGGAYVAMYGLNDLNGLGNSVEMLKPFTMALRMAIARFRAAAVFEDNHASVSYGGASVWQPRNVSTASPDGSGSTLHYNATSGGTITITTPEDFPGGTVTLGFANWSDGGGGTVTGTVNGHTYSVDTKAVARTDAKTPAILRIPNVPAGQAAYTFTTSDVSGGIGVMFDYWQWEPEEAQCPLVALVGQAKPLDYDSYSAGGPDGKPTDAGVDNLNAIQRAVAAEFGERVVFVEPPAIDKDPAFWSPGNIHPNLAGHALFANRIARVLLDEAAFMVTRLPSPSSSPSTIPDPSGPSRTSLGAAPPTSGTFARGDVRFNENASAGARAGWICTESGSPGTWAELPTARIGAGQAILSDGVATVTGLVGTKNATQVRLWQVNLSGTPGAPYVAAKTSGAGFTIHSTSSTDNSTIGWEVLSY